MKTMPSQVPRNAAARGICGDRAEQVGAHLASWVTGSVLGVTVLAALKVMAHGVGLGG